MENVLKRFREYAKLTSGLTYREQYELMFIPEYEPLFYPVWPVEEVKDTWFVFVFKFIRIPTEKEVIKCINWGFSDYLPWESWPIVRQLKMRNHPIIKKLELKGHPFLEEFKETEIQGTRCSSEDSPVVIDSESTPVVRSSAVNPPEYICSSQPASSGVSLRVDRHFENIRKQVVSEDLEADEECAGPSRKRSLNFTSSSSSNGQQNSSEEDVIPVKKLLLSSPGPIQNPIYSSALSMDTSAVTQPMSIPQIHPPPLLELPSFVSNTSPSCAPSHLEANTLPEADNFSSIPLSIFADLPMFEELLGPFLTPPLLPHQGQSGLLIDPRLLDDQVKPQKSKKRPSKMDSPPRDPLLRKLPILEDDDRSDRLVICEEDEEEGALSPISSTGRLATPGPSAPHTPHDDPYRLNFEIKLPPGPKEDYLEFGQHTVPPMMTILDIEENSDEYINVVDDEDDIFGAPTTYWREEVIDDVHPDIFKEIYDHVLDELEQDRHPVPTIDVVLKDKNRLEKTVAYTVGITPKRYNGIACFAPTEAVINKDVFYERPTEFFKTNITINLWSKYRIKRTLKVEEETQAISVFASNFVDKELIDLPLKSFMKVSSVIFEASCLQESEEDTILEEDTENISDLKKSVPISGVHCDVFLRYQPKLKEVTISKAAPVFSGISAFLLGSQCRSTEKNFDLFKKEEHEVAEKIMQLAFHSMHVFDSFESTIVSCLVSENLHRMEPVKSAEICLPFIETSLVEAAMFKGVSAETVTLGRRFVAYPTPRSHYRGDFSVCINMQAYVSKRIRRTRDVAIHQPIILSKKQESILTEKTIQAPIVSHMKTLFFCKESLETVISKKIRMKRNPELYFVEHSILWTDTGKVSSSVDPRLSSDSEWDDDQFNIENTWMEKNLFKLPALESVEYSAMTTASVSSIIPKQRNQVDLPVLPIMSASTSRKSVEESQQQNTPLPRRSVRKRAPDEILVAPPAERRKHVEIPSMNDRKRNEYSSLRASGKIPRPTFSRHRPSQSDP